MFSADVFLVECDFPPKNGPVPSQPVNGCHEHSLPSTDLLERQAAWLAPARARLLRRAGIAHRRSVLDLACGHGSVTGELTRRCGGNVVAVDCRKNILTGQSARFAGATVLCGDAEHLPLANDTFDLVFCQFALMWMDAPAVVREIRRVLTPGGVLAAIEPDFGGLIEHPPEIATRDLWLAALGRAGADPNIGRKLPALLGGAGFHVSVDLLDRLMPPSPLRFDLLAGLPLNDEEKALLQSIRRCDALLGDASQTVHLPMFLILAEIPRPSVHLA
jgi:SAM-dependent methyltransferase